MIKRYAVTVNNNRYEVEVEELEIFENSTENTEIRKSKSNINEVATQQNKLTPQNTQKVDFSDKDSKQISDKNIIAPMPGTINSINIKVGDKVKKNQVLLILEAMKMENEIVATNDATVKHINVDSGTSVKVGDLLLILE